MKPDDIQTLVESVDSVFSELAIANGSSADIWAALESIGFADCLVPESLGGLGADWPVAVALASRFGFYGLEAPVLETLVVRGLLAGTGREVPCDACSVAPHSLQRSNTGGCLESVPWGGSASHILAVEAVDGGERLLLLERASLQARPGRCFARHETVDFELGSAQPTIVTTLDRLPISPRHAMSLIYAAATAGALRRVTELTAEHVIARVQFGKPLSAFQVVQHQVAVLAGEAAAVQCAAAAAALAVESGGAEFEVLCAKWRANRGADVGAQISHQLHGAIGFTYEHALNRFTRRMAAWRSWFGSERECSEELGRLVLAGNEDALWRRVVRSSDCAEPEWALHG